ncbi:MAG TPA: nucleotidyltransferase domain-containing protein, partial [Verrucomicrobiae bacterium]|nr:nucleotidyltransferase domain-containing protein [Verrucomicrobiae bacterium]
RPDFRSDSDIDVLVEFTPGHAPGLDLIDIQDELSTLMGQPKIDLVTEKFLSPRIRNAVRDQALVIYEE